MRKVHTKTNCQCASCKSKRGEFNGNKNPFYGKKHTKDSRERMSKKRKGRKLSEETVNKLKEIFCGEGNPMYGKFGTNNPNFGRRNSKETILRMSDSRKISHKEGCQCCFCKSKRGENNGVDNGAYGYKFNSQQRSRLSLAHGGTGIPYERNKYPSSFFYIAEDIRKLDGNICQLCGKGEERTGRRLCVHHIDYDKKNCNVDNLITLCCSCNSKVNYNRQHWKIYFKGALEKGRNKERVWMQMI